CCTGRWWGCRPSRERGRWSPRQSAGGRDEGSHDQAVEREEEDARARAPVEGARPEGGRIRPASQAVHQRGQEDGEAGKVEEPPETSADGPPHKEAEANNQHGVEG